MLEFAQINKYKLKNLLYNVVCLNSGWACDKCPSIVC